MLTAERAVVLRTSARPIARTVAWPGFAGLVVLGWAPFTLAALRGGTDLVAGVAFAGVFASGAVAVAVEDDAAELVCAVPVPLAQRRLVRLVELLAALTVVSAVALAVGCGRDPALAASIDQRLPEAVAAGAFALAIASVMTRARVPGAALAGAVAAAASLAVMTGLAQRYHWLPGIGLDQRHGLWWIVAALGASATAWTWRDPATRALGGSVRGSP